MCCSVADIQGVDRSSRGSCNRHNDYTKKMLQKVSKKGQFQNLLEEIRKFPIMEAAADSCVCVFWICSVNGNHSLGLLLHGGSRKFLMSMFQTEQMPQAGLLNTERKRRLLNGYPNK